MFSCGGKGRCTTCKFEVVKGKKNLSTPNTVEERFFSLNLINENERLACQAKPLGDIEIKVIDANKQPHLISSIAQIGGTTAQ